ncbi:hypothetical protein OIU78_021332 [Salix suchowensis]|nr:hypothetical protein OIU78_021332 [Salix suchowensis]
MMLKRAFKFVDGGDGTAMGNPAPKESKRFRSAVTDVMGRLSVRDLVSEIEPFLRAVIRDEMELTVQRVLHSRSSFNQPQTSVKRGLMLQFVGKLPPIIFTGGKIEAEDVNPVAIVLMDANTSTIVTSGPLSSLKIEIVPLDADFGSDEEEDWTEGEFAANVIREREGRRPLVTGDLTVTLRDGVGQLEKEEAKLLWLKDHRGELYKKHHPPHLRDEIWRLEKIAKDGVFHKRLAFRGVKSVQDFLQLYMIDPTKLRNVIGSGISNKIWNAIIEHATTCAVDDSKFYSYFDAGQSIGLLFDSIYKVVGAMFDGYNYEPLHTLTPPQKVLVENIKRQAYENMNSFVQVDVTSLFGPSRSFTTLQAEPFNDPNLALQQLEFPVARQDQPELRMDLYNASSSTTSYGYAETGGPLEVWSPNGWPVLTSTQSSADDMSVVQAPTWCPGNSTWGPGNAFIFTASNEGDVDIFFCSSKLRFTNVPDSSTESKMVQDPGRPQNGVVHAGRRR